MNCTLKAGTGSESLNSTSNSIAGAFTMTTGKEIPCAWHPKIICVLHDVKEVESANIEKTKTISSLIIASIVTMLPNVLKVFSGAVS